MFENDTLEVSEETRAKLLEDLNKFHYSETRFNFINDHFGFRKKHFHLLMGTAGTGKTTLSRSLLMDIAVKHKVFFYSSEESLEQTMAMYSKRKTSNDVLKNINFWHERTAEAETKDFREWLRLLEIKIKNSKSEILFFDNLTTSFYYDTLKPNEQSEVISELHRILHACDIADVFIAHTANGVKDDQQGLISTSDIRGNRNLTNKAEFVYVYQKFICPPTGQSTSPTSWGTIRNLKARGYDVGKIYLLSFNPSTSEYLSDVAIPNTKFKDIYDSRFKLGK